MSRMHSHPFLRRSARPVALILLIVLAGAPVLPARAAVSSLPAPSRFQSAAAATADSKVDLVYQAYNALLQRFYNPVDGAALLNAAWQAAVTAAGSTAAPPVSTGGDIAA